MAITAQVSLWGLYKYDSTILDGLTIPSGMDSDVLKQNLLLETESLEILYPNPTFLKAAITVWAAERKEIWDKLYATTQLEYNPIENYDRIQDDTGNTTDRSFGTSIASSTGSTSGSSNDSSAGTSSGSNTSTASNTAYNSDTFKDTAKNESSGSNNTTSSNLSQTKTDMLSSNTAQNTGESIRANAFHSRVHGNIGVTTTQQMLTSEREVVQFCMQEFIIDDFISRFCVMVY